MTKLSLFGLILATNLFAEELKTIDNFRAAAAKPNVVLSVPDWEQTPEAITASIKHAIAKANAALDQIAAQDRAGSDEFGVVPLGMPLIAGPALLTALLILVDTVGLVFTLISLLVTLALVAIAFCNADLFTRWMGRQGLRGVSKIIALLLAAIAISLIRRGWQGT